MPNTLTLGRFFGIRVGVHVSWFIVYAFMVFSIGGSIGESVGGIARGLALALAAMCAALLFVSVILHEFAHALVARRYGVRTRGITLFLFGGVATLESEPPSPGAEVAIALAGPALSAVIAALAFGALALLERIATGPLGEALGLITAYVALANGVLAAFNLVPAFPMDGGRVLRAAIWRARRSRAAATGAASLVGLVLAGGLVVAGAVAAIGLRQWRSVWYVLIGAFLLRQGWLQLRDSRRAEHAEHLRALENSAAEDARLDALLLAPAAGSSTR